MKTDTYVRARIDSTATKRAAEALAERRLPFQVKAPNATTRKAIAELESGKRRKFAGAKALMADLNGDD